jgi:large subunit ribosomal protein L30
MLNIIQKRSSIGIPDKQRKILEALGLRKIGSSVRKEDNKATQGMISKIPHLLAVEKVAK